MPMACGTAVITSDRSSLPEVAGDAAMLVDPYDVSSIAESLRELLTDSAKRERLVARGTRRAELFSWDNAARKMLELYRERA